ncbi:MAG: hypothetical protein C0467_14780 [Planctomycetaceae bacterium]|nr:hypothetical protein [Planctomycetaceae bacterium]
MNEREALLRAVCDNPDEDTPRLVFSDWLQENGEEERAEFIRLQCQTANLPVASSARQHRENIINSLLHIHGQTWYCELPTGDGYRWGETFIRGFVADLTVLEVLPERSLEKLLDASPVTSLIVNCVRLQWEVLSECGYLDRLRVVTIDSTCVDSHVHAVCKIGPWPRLEKFVIAGTVTEDRRYLTISQYAADSLRNAFCGRLRLPPRGHML